MSDNQGFSFNLPQRREKKEFEPPPWERNQHGEFVKQQQRSATPEDEADAADEQQTPSPVVELTEAEAADHGNRSPLVARPVLSESRAAEMLYQLKAEEPPAGKEFSRIGAAAGVLMVGLGVMFIVWAVVMLVVASRRPGQGGAGAVFGLTVMALGICFAGGGAWFVFKSLRQQGVL